MADWLARDLGDMAELGRALAAHLRPPRAIGLEGPLGVGKTALVRAVLGALAYQEAVPSPTYTLIETYPLRDWTVHHLDLYRLGDPEELEFLGVRDLATPEALWFVEWPERGGDRLPSLEHRLHLSYTEEGRLVTGLPPLVVGGDDSHRA